MQQFFTSNIKLRDFLSIKHIARSTFENIIKIFKIDQIDLYKNFNTASNCTQVYYFTSDKNFDVDSIKSFWFVVDHMYINFNQIFFVFLEPRFFLFHEFDILFFVDHDVREWIFRRKTISKMIFFISFQCFSKNISDSKSTHFFRSNFFVLQNLHCVFVFNEICRFIVVLYVSEQIFKTFTQSRFIDDICSSVSIFTLSVFIILKLVFDSTRGSFFS